MKRNIIPRSVGAHEKAAVRGRGAVATPGGGDVVAINVRFDFRFDFSFSFGFNFGFDFGNFGFRCWFFGDFGFDFGFSFGFNFGFVVAVSALVLLAWGVLPGSLAQIVGGL